MQCASEAGKSHSWKFARTGGVNQVVIRNGSDIANLDQLNLKLWMALSMPTRGVEFDPRTADIVDSDKNGRIRPPEVLAAIQWAMSVFKNPDDLMKGGDTVELSAIKDADILAGARRVLANIGKPDAIAISLADVFDREKFPRQIKRLSQFFDEHGRSAAADINSLEFISFFVINFNLPAQSVKIFSGEALFKFYPVKGAIWAEFFTERNMKIKKPLFFVAAGR